jgi:uncharacterized pyridoxal phosphate-containing UPF0001 family protein
VNYYDELGILDGVTIVGVVKNSDINECRHLVDGGIFNLAENRIERLILKAGIIGDGIT